MSPLENFDTPDCPEGSLVVDIPGSEGSQPAFVAAEMRCLHLRHSQCAKTGGDCTVWEILQDLRSARHY